MNTAGNALELAVRVAHAKALIAETFDRWDSWLFIAAVISLLASFIHGFMVVRI